MHVPDRYVGQSSFRESNGCLGTVRLGASAESACGLAKGISIRIHIISCSSWSFQRSIEEALHKLGFPSLALYCGAMHGFDSLARPAELYGPSYGRTFLRLRISRYHGLGGHYLNRSTMT